MKLLENKTFFTKSNNWYAPTCEFHEKYNKSVERIMLMDATSSAGDWSGFFIQRTGRKSCVAIPFHQENHYPGDGFILYTGTAFMKGTYEIDFINAAKENWTERYVNGYWED